MKHISFLLKATIILLLLTISLFAQSTGSISGKVTYTADQSTLHGATVQIVQLKKTVQTDDSGVYKFENIPAGKYTILVKMDGFSDSAKTVDLSGTATLDFELQIAGVKEQVTVSASGAEQSTLESFQTVDAVSSNTIAQRAATSIGEVLEGESGVAKRSFGAGSSRPVLRGFDGDRVLIAQDGVRSGSLGSQSGDHGEPVDTLSVERIEVVKGPATLLYGSNAIGGVVNAISSHEDTAHEGFRGFFTGIAGTNNNQLGSSGGLEYGYQKFMVFGDGSLQKAGDYKTPLGFVPNSSSRSGSGSVGAGYYDTKGWFTGNFNYDKRRYGIPYAGFIESGGATNDDIDIKMRVYNLKLNGGFRDVNSFVTGGKFTFNYNKYQHQELEEETVNTTFRNQTFAYRAMFEQKPIEKLTGRFGFDGFSREYLVDGSERLIDGKVKQNSFSVFGLEELNLGRVSFQFGGRVEHNAYNPENNSLLDKSFTGFSGAAGIRIGLWDGGAFVANYSNSYRAPALEELYNNGPHVGTVSFEIGNQNLKRERSNGLDFGLRHQSNRFRFDANFYYYRISDFVYLAYVDENNDGKIDIEDNLPVAAYSQNDASYAGAEVNFETDINKYLGVFAKADVVRAKLIDSNLNLPRIPPAHASVGLELKYKGLSVKPEGSFSSPQTKLYPLETRTAGYGLFNVSASYIIGKPHYAHIFGVNAYNLLDKEYRNHLSFIKELAPEIGRGIRFTYTVRFF
jgi:iron complex outermembrane receptor protein